jgi:signal transduction histidine kinase
VPPEAVPPQAAGPSENHIRKELNDLLFGAMPLAIGVSTALALVLAMTQAGAVGWTYAGVWLGVAVLSSIYRILEARNYRRADPSPDESEHWGARFRYTAFVGGLSWGLASLWLFAPDDIAYQTFLVMIVAGASGGAVTTLSARFGAAAAFLVPTLLPLVLRFTLQGDQLSVIMGGLTLLFLVALLSSARRIGTSLRENVVLRLESVPREAALRKNANLLKKTGTLARVGGWEIDRESGELHWAEQGFPIEDLLGEADPSLDRTLEFFEADAQDTLRHALSSALQRGEPIDLVLPIVTVQEQHRWVHVIGEPRVVGGQIVGVTGAFQDITALRSSENALRAHIRVLERLQAITAQVQLPYALRVKRLLELGREVLGRESGAYGVVHDHSVRAQDFVGFQSPPLPWDREDFAPLWAVEEGAPVSTHEEVRDHRPPFGLESWAAAPVYVDGSVSGILIFGNLTDAPSTMSDSERALVRLLAQWLGGEHERQKADRLKDEFVSTVSHELRTPLTSIGGSLSLLSKGVVGDLPEHALELVDMAQRNSERLVLLINDLLDMEKIASGIMDFEVSRHDLATVVRDSVTELRGFAEQHQVSLVLDEDLPSVAVDIDSRRLTQVMSNLLSNSAKFAPDGSEVGISIEVESKWVRVSVRDEGHGIPMHMQDHIFDKFTQLDGSDRRQQGGTGLGLAITRSLIERMGGRIHLRSRPGEGTTFFFELPLAEPA